MTITEPTPTMVFPAVIDAPAPQPPRGGLFALGINDSQEGGRAEGWTLGFSFYPYGCDALDVEPVTCGVAATRVPAANPGVVSYMPFRLVASDRCSTMQQAIDHAQRASVVMRAYRSDALEREFWTGAVNDENPHLADSTANSLGTGLGIQQGLTRMDQALTAALHGVAGMVHVPPRWLTEVQTRFPNALRWDTDRYRTPNGHTIVSGSGYTGGAERPTVGGSLPAAPDLVAATPTLAIYGTPPVHVKAGAQVNFDSPTSRFDLDVNDQVVYVEEIAAAFYVPCAKYTLTTVIGS